MQDEFDTKLALRAHAFGVAKALTAIAKQAPRQHDMVGETALFLQHAEGSNSQDDWTLAFRILAERNFCRRVGPMWKFRRPFRHDDVIPLLKWNGIVRAFDQSSEAR
jgi:hypothetical protein